MFNRDKVFLGITPTVWTNDDMPILGNEIAFEQCVSEIALAGFQGCSVGHKFPTNISDLKRALALRGLRVSEPWHSTYFTAQAMERQTMEGFERQLEFIREMGGKHIVVAELGHAVHQLPVAALPNKPVFSQAQWSSMVKGLNQIGRIAKDNGMELCYHPHVGTGVQNRDEIDRLMAETDPSCVYLLLDTGHLVYAGEDPLKVARAYSKRIRHAHLKDIRKPVLEESIRLGRSFLDSMLAGVFTVPGDGHIGFKSILEVLSDADFEGWLVVEAEQDHAKAHPLTYAMKSRAYLRELIGW